MTELIIIIITIILTGIVTVLFVKREVSRNESVHYLKQDIEAMRRDVGENLWKTAESAREQSRESSKLIREITEELTKVGESQKQVLTVTDQLKNLQDMLKNPQQRGVIGEFYLETLLRNVMPPEMYKMQYLFPNGTKVDAAITIKDGQIIPIDAKFSLTNYNRMAEVEDQAEKERLEKAFVNDLKERIVETSKYIQPEEGTTDFAFMFIPHEAIYYDLLINKIGLVTEETENLVQRAVRDYRVIIVSPTSFLAYLQTVIQGLKMLEIEKSTKEIQKRVEGLAKHLSVYQKHLDSLGKTMGTAVGHYNRATKEFGKIDKDIYKITGGSIDSKLTEISSPDEID